MSEYVPDQRHESLLMQADAAGAAALSPRDDWWGLPARLRLAVIGSLAGLLAGVLIGGIGSRLAMRLVALAASRHPVLTPETFFVLLMAAVAGTGLGLLFIVVRPRLPGAGVRKGVAFGLGLLVLIGVPFFWDGTVRFDSELREGPLPLGIGLFSLLFLGYGVVVAALTGLLDRFLPAASRRRPGSVIAYSIVALMSLPVGLLGLVLILVGLFALVHYVITGRPWVGPLG